MIWVALIVLGGTLVTSVVLLGRFTLMVIGFFLIFSALIAFQQAYLTDVQGVAILALALVCLLAGRPSWLRRGHRARITRRIDAA